MRQAWFFLAGVLLLSGTVASAKDLGFRYRDGACVNDKGEKGLNPRFFGQCGDLQRLVLARFSLDEMDLSGSVFSGSDLQETSFERADLTGTNFSNSVLSGVSFAGANIIGTSFRGSRLKNIRINDAKLENIDFAEADLTGNQFSYVSFVNCRFMKANLEAVKLEAVEFLNNDLSEANMASIMAVSTTFRGGTLQKANLTAANLSQAKVMSVNLKAAKLKAATIRGADLSSSSLLEADLRRIKGEGCNLSGSDLRGADIRSAVLADANADQTRWEGALYSKDTQLPFKNPEKMGLIFKAAAKVFILWDTMDENVTKARETLVAEDFEVTVPDKSWYQYSGASLQDYSLVLHLVGDDYEESMPMAGQKALVDYVKAGGTVVETEYISYAPDYNPGLTDLALFKSSYSYQDDRAEFVAERKADPLLQGVSAFDFTEDFCDGGLREFNSNPSMALMETADGIPIVAVRPLGKGRVVGLAFAAYEKIFELPEVRKILINAAGL